MTGIEIYPHQLSVLRDALDLAIGDQQEYLAGIHAELDYRGDDTGLADCEERLADLRALRAQLEKLQ